MARLDSLLARLSKTRSGADPALRLSLVEEIGREMSPDALEDILPLLLSPLVGGGPVGAAAASTLEEALRHAPASQFPALEDAARRGRPWYALGTDAWGALTPEALLARAPTASRTAYFGIASFHPSGYVREAAVRSLAKSRDVETLPFLLLRLNDWVSPVRVEAEGAVRDLEDAAPHSAWARALPLLVGMRAQGRHRMPRLTERVARRLASRPGGFWSSFPRRLDDRALERAAHRLALEVGGEAAREGIERAVASGDVLVRLRAARVLRSGALEAPEAEAALLTDPSVGVRREVLLGRVERDDDPEPALRAALLDPSAGVRSDARFFLSKRRGDVFDAAAVYRRALGDALEVGTARGALGGLAETGLEADAALTLGWLEDDRPTVRAAALRAVAALDSERAAPLVRDGLEAEAPAVAKEAVRLVSTGAVAGFDPEAVLSRAYLDGGPARSQAFRGVLDLPLWTRLPVLVRALRSDPVRSRSALEAALRRVPSVFTQPTPADLAALRSALEDAPSDVGRRVEDAVPGL